MVYFVHDVERDLIKIGYSGNLPGRLPFIRSEWRATIHVLAVMPGGRADEKAMHLRFVAHRSRGEWYRMGDDLLAFINRSATKWRGEKDLPGDRPHP